MEIALNSVMKVQYPTFKLKDEICRGMGQRDERVVIILDIERGFQIEELNIVRQSIKSCTAEEEIGV